MALEHTLNLFLIQREEEKENKGAVRGKKQVLKMMNTVHVLLGAFLVLLFHVFNVLVLKPRSLRSKLQRQGIHGPSPHFYFGNIPEIKMLVQQAHTKEATAQNKDKDVSMSHNWTFTIFPHLEKWRKQYGQLLCSVS